MKSDSKPGQTEVGIWNLNEGSGIMSVRGVPQLVVHRVLYD